MKKILALGILFSSMTAIAHPGNTDKYGCHTDKRIGYYHCHTEKPQKNKAMEIFEITQPKKEDKFNKNSLFVKSKETK